MQRGHVGGLDGLRGIAALMVFAEHQFWPGHWMMLGKLGVELFFVLSGYLIVGILSDRAGRVEAGRATRWSEVKRFFVHRSFRIFPAYYFLIAVMAVIGLMGLMRINFSLFPVYLTYTTNLYYAHWLHDWPVGQNFGHFWTLAIEEQFYVLSAPLFLCFMPKRHKTICWGLIATAVIATAAMILLGQPWFTLQMDSFVNFGYLALGGLISQSTLPRPGRSSLVPALGLGGALGLSLACFFLRPEDGPAFAVSVGFGLLAGATIWGLVVNQGSALVRWLEVKPLRAMGKISYAFYLYHLFVKLPPTGIAFEGVDLIIVANLAVTLALAQLSWMLIEQPALRLRSRLIPDAPPPSRSVGPASAAATEPAA